MIELIEVHRYRCSDEPNALFEVRYRTKDVRQLPVGDVDEIFVDEQYLQQLEAERAALQAQLAQLTQDLPTEAEPEPVPAAPSLYLEP